MSADTIKSEVKRLAAEKKTRSIFRKKLTPKPLPKHVTLEDIVKSLPAEVYTFYVVVLKGLLCVDHVVVWCMWCKCGCNSISRHVRTLSANIYTCDDLSLFHMELNILCIGVQSRQIQGLWSIGSNFISISCQHVSLSCPTLVFMACWLGFGRSSHYWGKYFYCVWIQKRNSNRIML